MVLGSPEGLEKLNDLQKQDGPALGGELGLKFQVDKDDKADVCVIEKGVRNDKNQVDLNEQQGKLDFPSLPSDFRYGGSLTPCENSHSSVQTESDHDVVMGTKVDYDQERSHSPSKNQHPYEREMELHDSFFHKSSSSSSIDTFQNEMGTEDYAHSREFLLTASANQGEEIEENSNLGRPTSPPHDEKIKEIISEKLQYELTKSVCAEIEGEATEHQTGKLFSSPRLELGSTESENKNFRYSRSSPTESRKLDKPHSCQQSPKRTPKQSTSPVTGRQMSVSPEKSLCIELSPSVLKPSSSKQGVEDPLFSPRSHKHKHSSSPERSDLGKAVPSRNHLSPARRTSASPRGTRQGSQLKDGSSLKHESELPKIHYSPPNYRRQARSRSPTRRRDSSSGYKRDYRDRSRSRSPYTRDSHRRSPRRRYSPRRRSPPSVYHSRHRSPRKRPWSPPSNRSTGIGKPGKNLFVAGFSFSTTERDLERKFSRFGRVRDVRIVRDKRSGDSRGFGFLSLERDEEADAAIRALDKTDWNGRIVLVEKSKSSVR